MQYTFSIKLARNCKCDKTKKLCDFISLNPIYYMHTQCAIPVFVCMSPYVPTIDS